MASNYYTPAPVNTDTKIDSSYYRNVDFNQLISAHDNVLLGYDSVTWNATLSAVSQYDWLVMNKNPKANISKYVIARSGVTGRYIINSMSFKTTYPGAPGLTTNSTALSFDIEIHELNSMRLLDELVTLSNELKYKKFADIPLLLDIEYVGYKDGVPEIVPGTDRHWQLRVNDMTIKSSNTATCMTYNLKAVTAHGYIEDHIRVIKEHITIDASSVKDYVNKFETALNSQIYSQYPYLPDLFPDYFNNKKFVEFVIHPDLAVLGMNGERTDSESGSQYGQTNSKTFNHAPNQTIQQVMDAMMDCVETRNKNESRYFVHVLPKSTYVGYDPARALSVYKYKIYLVPYQTGDMKEYSDMVNGFDAGVFIDKVVDLISTDPSKSADNIPLLNMKRYDYTFTGRNEEILNFEMKFDTQYVMAIERNADSLRDLDNSAGQTSNLYLTNSQLLTLDTESTEAIAMKGKAAKDALAAGAPMVALSTTEQQAAANYDNWIKTQRSLTQTNRTMTQQEQERVYGGMKPTDKYVEDIRYSYDLTEMQPYTNITRIDKIPTDYRNTKETNSNSRNENTTSAEQERRLIRSNYYNRSFMVKLDLKVYGDPYWIPDNDSIDTRLNEIIENGNFNGVDPSRAEFLTCEPFFVLNLKPTREISNDTGVLTDEMPTVFSQNVYRVVGVTHDFSSTGKFTQTLNGALVVRCLNKE